MKKKVKEINWIVCKVCFELELDYLFTQLAQTFAKFPIIAEKFLEESKKIQ